MLSERQSQQGARVASTTTERSRSHRSRHHRRDKKVTPLRKDIQGIRAVAVLNESYAKSYVSALHSRLGQIMTDAVHDGIIPRSPISRRTAPGKGKQIPYVATTEQVWTLHEALPKHARGIVLLGAFAGLRRNEIIGLRVEDVDFMRGVITPAVQYKGVPLKIEESKNPIPIPQVLSLELGRNPREFGSKLIVTNAIGRQMSPNMANYLFSTGCGKVEGLPAGFRIQDLRHYFASLLIASGLDVKTVQARLRHASAKTTLDTYSHLWPDRDETSRAAIEAVFAGRAKDTASPVGDLPLQVSRATTSL